MAVAAPVQLAASPTGRRWRLDAWLLARPGVAGVAGPGGVTPPAYGGTQAGAVLRYALAEGGRAPAAHVRATWAPGDIGYSQLAVGVGARPLAAVPVRVLAEARVTRSAGRTEIAPALLAHTELAPFSLPAGVSVDSYAQAGWVGGRFATPFADGQARATRPVAAIGPVRVSAGAGAWGGAQRGAARLDVGPSVVLALADGPVPLRASLDYRLRVAGNAAPASGPALTLSTGF